jgi:hypothetical protein
MLQRKQFDGNKTQLFKDTDTQQDAFRKDSKNTFQFQSGRKHMLTA